MFLILHLNISFLRIPPFLLSNRQKLKVMIFSAGEHSGNSHILFFGYIYSSKKAVWVYVL